MTRNENLEALRRLRDGRDPATNEPLPADHLCQRGDVVRALFAAVLAMEGVAAPADASEAPTQVVRFRPPRAGVPWTADEDRRLAEEFDGGAAERDLAASFGRSLGSIRARLIRLGRGPLLADGPAPRYPITSDDPGVNDVVAV